METTKPPSRATPPRVIKKAKETDYIPKTNADFDAVEAAIVAKRRRI